MRFLSKILIILAGFFILPVVIQAYSPDTTHRALTQETVDFHNNLYPDRPITERQKYWIMEGSKNEDQWPRWWFHFYDPVNDFAFNGENLGSISPQVFKSFSKLAISSDDPEPAVRWALDSRLQNRYTRYGGDRSWSRAKQYFLEGNEKQAFITLGHILHLLQDMGVPDHTRNDPHPPLNESSGFFAEKFGEAIGEDGSPYESYSKRFSPENIKDNFNIVRRLLDKNALPVNFKSPESYLSLVANYSNKYFFSKDTLLSDDYNSPKIVKEDENFGYSRDENGDLFESVKVETVPSFETDISKVYDLGNEDKYYSILNNYFDRLSQKNVLNGAGLINLFHEQVRQQEDESRNKVVDYNFDNIPGSESFNKSFSLTGEISKITNKTKSFFGNVGSLVSDTFKSQSEPEFVAEIDITEDESEEETSFDTDSVDNEDNVSVSCSYDLDDSSLQEDILINEVAWMGDGESYRNEWIELKNMSESSIDLEGYKVIDESRQINIDLPAENLEPGDFYLLSRNSNVEDFDIQYSGSLSNSEETLGLFNSNCSLLDKVEASPDWPAGDNSTKQTMERVNKNSWRTSNASGGTPGFEEQIVVQEVNPVVSINKDILYKGEIINESGQGFSPESRVELNFVLPDGRLVTDTMVAGIEGSFLKPYRMPGNAMFGEYEFYAIDVLTGEKSNTVSYTVKRRIENESNFNEEKDSVDSLESESPSNNRDNNGEKSKQSDNNSESKKSNTPDNSYVDNDSKDKNGGEEKKEYQECRYSDGTYPYHNGLVINEVAWMGSENSHADEWIEIKNTSNSHINMDGYQIMDKANQMHVIFKDRIVSPGEYILLERTNDNSVPDSQADIIFNGSIGNNSEGLKLHDNNCGLVDFVEANPDWPAGKNLSSEKYTMVRSNDLSWYNSQFSEGTAGSRNRFATTNNNEQSNGNESNNDDSNTDNSQTNNNDSNNDQNTGIDQDTDTTDGTSEFKDQVLISEIMPGAGTGVSDQEFIELYNPTNSNVDITDWSLEKKVSSDSSTVQVLVDSFGTDLIEEDQYFLIASEEYKGLLADQVYSSGNRLAYEDDVVILKDSEGKIVDQVGYLSSPRGSSFERHAVVEGSCVIPDGENEYKGNGCTVEQNFIIRDNPVPQNSNSLPEPRTGPATSGDKFSAVYNPNSLNVEFNWSPYADFEGSFDGFTYEIKDVSSASTSIIYSSSSAWHNEKLEEIGRDYSFKFKAVDSNGMESDISTSTISAPSLVEDINFYEDTSLNGGDNYLIDLKFGSYPFVPDIYKGGDQDSWKALIFYLNSPAKKQIDLKSDDNWIPSDTTEIIPVVYTNCSGSKASRHSLILPDNKDRCSPTGGGLNVASFNLDNLMEDKLINLKTSFTKDEISLTSDDYLSVAYYSFYKSGRGSQDFKLAAVDTTKFNFNEQGDVTKSPVMATSSVSTSLDKDSSFLTVSWDSATDIDSKDSSLNYDINFSPQSGLDGDLWRTVSSTLSYEKQTAPGDEFLIGVRAQDEFGNYSNIATTTWEYPPTQFYISQEFSDGWSDKWGFVKHSTTESDAASLQSFVPDQDFSFNKVSVKVWQEEVEMDGSSAQPTNLRMAVYPDTGSSTPDFSNKIVETNLGAKITPTKGDSVNFSFDEDINVNSELKYWLVLDIQSTHRDSWFDGRWHNAIATGGSVYDKGEGGKGFGKGKNDDSLCSTNCSYSGNYSSGSADWWFKIGRE